MMKAKELPGWFWAETVTTAVFLLNWAPTLPNTECVEGIIPFEVWHDVKAPIHFLRAFGCIAQL